MGKLSFDGVNLKDGSKTIANVRGSDIREGNGSTVLCNIRGNDIRSGNGSTVLANVRGDEIRSGNGSTKIGNKRDVDAAIGGPGGVTKAALWFWFCR